MTTLKSASGAWKYPATCLLLLMVWGCGVKTSPYPADAILPGPVSGLSQFVTDQGELVLSWNAPANNMVGRPLQSLGGFEIEMSDNPANEIYCETCPHRYEKIDLVPAMTPPPGLMVAQGPYTWRYKLTSGHVYRFRVLSVAKNGGVHPGSAVPAVVWSIPAPGALAGFGASMRDKAVELHWSRPSAGYMAEVEKRASDGQWKPLPDFDGASGRYVDLKVDYENTYVYRGRLTSQKGETRTAGPWSDDRAVNVLDATPPNPPGYLDAALAANGVRLTWESLAFDPDLAGYRVYRQLSGEDGFTRISGPLLKANTFFDPVRLTPDATARYRVTSVDGSPRANESGPSPTADVLLDPPAEAPPRP
ncbi:hypothetical protein C4J81_06285 [Deltaproteobacteria bacterium Smac51]|nr:hypothetical protein C4J81_06285 [Deltaproteobacteria bacterium Smac51]